MDLQKKLSILIIPGLTFSTVNKCIKIGEILYNHGHRIIFIIINAYKGILSEYGFEEMIIPNDTFVQCNNIEEFLKESFIFINNTNQFDSSLPLLKKLRQNLLWDKDFVRQLKEFNNKIKEIIDLTEPHVIISDSSNYVIPSVIKSKRLCFMFIGGNPLPFLYDERTPPPYMGLPSNDATEWPKHRNEYNEIIGPLNVEINKLMIEEGLLPLPPNRLHCESINVIYNFPKEIDYYELRPMPLNWIHFDAFIKTEKTEFVIPEYLRDDRKKLILLTMGSIASGNVEFMKHLIQILAQTPHRYIISKGPNADLYDLPDNMYGERFIIQTKVMPLVDMVILHGGSGGITEAFYYGKPMIIIPICFDQYDNAQRVVEKGFGLRMNQNVNANELINAIEKILNDKELEKRMKEISKRIQSEDISSKLIHLIESQFK